MVRNAKEVLFTATAFRKITQQPGADADKFFGAALVIGDGQGITGRIRLDRCEVKDCNLKKSPAVLIRSAGEVELYNSRVELN